MVIYIFLEMYSILLKANINYHTHNSPLVIPVPNQINQVHNLTRYFFTFILILSPALHIVLTIPIQASCNVLKRPCRLPEIVL